MVSNPNPNSSKRILRRLFLFVGVVTLFVTGYELVMRFAFGQTHEAQSRTEGTIFAVIHIIAAVFLVALMIPVLLRIAKTVNRTYQPFGWLFTWRTARRVLIGLAILITLLAVTYAAENWRGKRAWENCRRELEAKGEVLDWNAYIPPPVPDEQNIFKAPKMHEWFVRPGWVSGSYDWATNELMKRLSSVASQRPNRNPALVTVVEVTVLKPNANRSSDRDDAVLRLDDPTVGKQAAELVQNATGPSALGAQRFNFIARPLNEIKPAHALVQTDKTMTIKEITQLFPSSASAPANSRLQVESAGSNSFRVLLNPTQVYTAAEYLAWGGELETDFDLIREALKRPYARMDGDYQQPFSQPIPNFVCIRNVAQTLAQRAQCYLLLGQPEKALRELTLIHDLSRLLEGAPTGKPMTIVAAMINVAVAGLYVDTIADGFRLHAWREPQLAAIQHELKEINLPPNVAQAFRCEPAGVCRTLEITPPAKLGRMFSNITKSDGRSKFNLLQFMPRGWIYQNMAAIAWRRQKLIEGFDPAGGIVLPHKLDNLSHEFQKEFGHSSPYTFLAAIASANYARAIQTLARNQTMANLGQLVCALERHRLTNGQFPETLDALLPRFVEKIPHDIIGGKPLKYRRTEDGQFVLYSIGWNEQDDGGIEVKTKTGSPDLGSGDWVWGYAAR